MTKPVRLIVGISGASGAIYGVRLLEALASLDCKPSAKVGQIGR